MALKVEIVGDDSFGNPDELIDVLRFAFDHIESRPDGEWELTVLLADAKKIVELHGSFFDDPTDTDVMSFPSDDLSSVDGGYLGDIAVSIDMAREQAIHHRRGLDWEVAYIALHGLLHLLGYDDRCAPDRQDMLEIQERFLTDWRGMQ